MSHRYCVVGIGGHARNKLIPAILANNQKVVGLVSTKAREFLPFEPVFANLDSALEELPHDTIFVISTPPAMHFEQVQRVLLDGRDVVVEKPAFVSANDSSKIYAICQEKGNIVVEGMMHRHTMLYKRLAEYWFNNRNRIVSIDAVFLIPEMPSDTFRHNSEITSSCLFDMGCYAISLLSDLSLPLDSLRISHISNFSINSEVITIIGMVDDVKISIRIGLSDNYRNVVELRTSDNETAHFWPFFYGRPGFRHVSFTSNGKVYNELIEEGNAFQAMFAIPRSEWLSNQVIRSKHMIEVATSLELLSHELVLAT